MRRKKNELRKLMNKATESWMKQQSKLTEELERQGKPRGDVQNRKELHSVPRKITKKKYRHKAKQTGKTTGKRREQENIGGIYLENVQLSQKIMQMS